MLMSNRRGQVFCGVFHGLQWLLSTANRLADGIGKMDVIQSIPIYQISTPTEMSTQHTQSTALGSEFEFEPFISPRIVMVGVVALGALSYFIAETISPYSWITTNRAISYGLLMSVLAIIGWTLTNYRPALARWFALFVIILAVHLGHLWLRFPGSLAWVTIPAALAASILGLRMATVAITGETLVILFLASSIPPIGIKIGSAEAITTLAALWVVFLAIFVTRFELRSLAMRLSQQYGHAKHLLKEARDSRAEVVQALDDLAHANRQLMLLNQRVSDLRSIAEEGQKAKTNFVAQVSHEFRTPLNMIIGLVDLLVDAPEIYDATLSPRMRDALQIIYRNCQHLTNMVNDVLDLSRIETERMTLHKEHVSLKELIENAVDVVRPLLESKKLAVRVNVADDVPNVYCDGTRVEQVILNLVSNCARFTEKGGISIQASVQGHYLQVSIADTGMGISATDLGRIFEPFTQGTADSQRAKAGSGLGLSISKQFIELHGGRMWVESELGIGTTFYFGLPLFSPSSPTTRPGHQISESWIWHERRSSPSFPDSHYYPRIVVCDETGDLYAMLTRIAGEVELIDTREVAGLLAALKHAPAQAVLVNVATTEGLDRVSQAVKQEAKGTPILGCTIPRSLDQVKKLGLQTQLTKPITRVDLARTLAEYNGPVERVFVVDDDPEAAELFAQMLRVCDSSLIIETIHDGEEALNRLRACPPDIMFLDYVMPKMDGLKLLEVMSHDDDIPMVPTFLVSAQAPWDTPPKSNYLYVTVDDGFSLNNLLLSALDLSSLLLHPHRTQDSALE